MAKWKQDHIIQKLTFEIEINEKSKFHPLADRLETIVRSSLTQKIEEALDEVNQSGRVIQINQLEIDLGNIAEKDLEKVLKEQMIEALKKELEKHINKARPYSSPELGTSSSTTVTATEIAKSIFKKQQITNIAQEDLLRQQQEKAQQSSSTKPPITTNIAKEDLLKQQLSEKEGIEQKTKKIADALAEKTPTNAAKIDAWQTQAEQTAATNSSTTNISTVAEGQQSNAAIEDELRQQKAEEIERTKATTLAGQSIDQATTKSKDIAQPHISDEKTAEEHTSTQESTGINAAQEDLLTRRAVEQASLSSSTSPDDRPTELLEEEKNKQVAQILETEQQKKTDSADDNIVTLANTAKDDLLRPQQEEQIVSRQQKEQERKAKEAEQRTSGTDEESSSTETSPSKKQMGRRIPDISEMTSVPIPKETSLEEVPTTPKRRKPFRRGPYYLDTAYERAQNPFSGKKKPFRGADPANMDIPVYRADYSHQVDGILYFLKRGRLPDWFSLGEATLDDLMLDLLEEHPQIIRPRLKELAEEKMLLDRLIEQFLPETLSKIQEVAEIEIDEDAMNPLFDLREKASVSPFVQATIETDYLYALFVNGLVPWWIKNVESDSLEAIVRSGTGYNFFKEILTQAHSVEQSKQILRNILKYLTEVDIQNLFGDYRKNEYGEATLLFIILDIATVEGLHFKDTLIEILKALDGIGETVIVPRQKEDTETASKKEPSMSTEANKDLYALFAEGLKAPWLQYLPVERLDVMMTATTNLSIFSDILSEARSVASFKSILERILEHLSDSAIQKIFSTFTKENFQQNTLLYKILDRAALEQSSFTNTLTAFVRILQTGRLPEGVTPTTSKSNQDLYALFAEGVKAPWLQYLPVERLELMMTTTANLSIFSQLLTENKSTDAFKSILQRILEQLSDRTIETIFKTYRKENYGQDTLLYKILDTTAFEQSSFKNTLTNFVNILQSGRLPESVATSSSPNKDLYTLFAEGTKAPWLQYLPAKQLEVMMTATTNLNIFSQLLTQNKSTDAFKNILQRILEQLNDTAIDTIFKSYRQENYSRDTFLYKILDTAAFEQKTFKDILTTFIDVLQAGRLPESLVPRISGRPNKDLYTLFVEGKKEPWLQYIPAERLDIMMSTVPNLDIFGEILTESRSIDSFKNILQYILEHLGDTAIETIFKTYKKENYGRDTLLYKILDRTAFEQSSFKTTLTAFIGILQVGRLPDRLVQTTEDIQPPTDDNKIKDDLYELFVNGTTSSWFESIDNKKRETILLSATNLAVLRTLLTQPRTILSLKNILQNLLQYIPESLLQRIFQRYTAQDLGRDTLLYNIVNTVASHPNIVKTTLTDFVRVLNTGKLPELSQAATIELEPSTADEIIADLHALLVDGVKAAWIEQITPKRWETLLISPASLRFFRDILSLPKPTDIFITILENIVRYLSQNDIQKILQSYRRFDFGEGIVMFRILNLVETKRLNYKQALIELSKTLKEEKEKEDLNTQVENTEPPAVYAMRDDLNELFIKGSKVAWIERVSAQKWEQMLSSAMGLKYFKNILTKPRTIRSLKQVLQNMLIYLPDSLLQKILSTYTKEDLGQETLLFKILDVNEWRKTSFKATINEFIDILDTGKLPTSPSQDPDSFASSEGVEKKELSLEEKLNKDLNKYKTMAEQNETSTTELDIIEIIDYFLKTASLPVQSKAYDLITFEKEFQQAIKEQPKQVVDKIKMVTRDAILQNKALGLLTKETYQLLIKKLQPVRAASLIRYFDVVHTLSSKIIQEGLPNLHVILYASKVKAEDINAAHYMQDFVKLVVRENLANPITVIENIQKALRETSAEASLTRDLIGHLEVLKNKTRVSKRLKHQEARKPTERTSVPYPFKDGALNQAIYIRNAGMVLLWPFLGHYFGRLKMLTPSNTFKTPEMAVRGVHLLQFLTTKHPGSEEHELMLNKILCGIPIETPIPYSISLTEEERQLSESLLRAIIKQWKALGNSSIDGLRGGFLIRDGRLQKSKSDKWTLRIEKKPYDILLGKLPWGYSMVKISWMPSILTVEWG